MLAQLNEFLDKNLFQVCLDRENLSQETDYALSSIIGRHNRYFSNGKCAWDFFNKQTSLYPYRVHVQPGSAFVLVTDRQFIVQVPAPHQDYFTLLIGLYIFYYQFTAGRFRNLEPMKARIEAAIANEFQ